MKYPKRWEGASKVFVSSSKRLNGTEDEHREFALMFQVHRPGTPDHNRCIYVRPNYAELLQLKKEIEHHLSLD